MDVEGEHERRVGFRVNAKALALSLLAVATLLTSATAQELRITELMSDNEAAVSDDDGAYGDWVELHNAGAAPVSLEGYRLGDTEAFDEAWPLPAVTVEAEEYVIVWCVGDGGAARGPLYADFRLDADGEAVTLFAPDGAVVDVSPAWPCPRDISLGRRADAPADWAYFPLPTPWAPNESEAFGPPPVAPSFSPVPSTQQSGPFRLRISTDEPDATVRYTLDGSAVTEESPEFGSSIAIGANAVVRARAFRQNALPGVTATASYLFERALTLPVVSLAVDPEGFFGANGIYVRPGTGYERDVHLEYFGTDGTLGFGQAMGVKMHAPDRFKHRSMRLYARERYGEKAVEYPLFDDLPVERFRRVILRNGGNDGTEKMGIHVKDAFAHELYAQLRPRHATAAYAPAHVFINGDYFGLYNLRERQDEHYLRTHYGVECDAVDFLEYDYAEPGGKKTRCGDWDAWEALRTYVLEHDLREPEAFAYVTGQIDVDDLVDYQAFEIFIGNVDWLNNNIKFWRERRPGAKWRWLLWDTEYGMGTTADNAAGQPDFDYMTMALDWGGWGTGDYTWLLRKLTENEGFRDRFLLRYGDLLNTTFRPGHVLPTLDSAVARIAPDLPRQFARWGTGPADYEEHLRHTRDYLTRRRDLARANAARAFDLDTETRAVRVDVSDAAAGRVRVNSLLLRDGLPWLRDAPAYPWTGDYLAALDVTLTALPAPGYRFSHWAGSGGGTEATLILDEGRDRDLVAVFEPADPSAAPRLYLNEIVADNQGSHADELGRATDWIELYNAGDAAVDLAGYFLTDDAGAPDTWPFPDDEPEATTVPAGGYLVVFADGAPELGALHADFRLSKDGEYVGLYRRDSAGVLSVVDEVAFPALGADEAFARLPDGGPDWGKTGRATPGGSNERATALQSVTGTPSVLRLSPNPASTTVSLAGVPSPTQEKHVSLRNVLGQLVLATPTRATVVDVGALPAGLYTAEVRQGAWRGTSALVVE